MSSGEGSVKKWASGGDLPLVVLTTRPLPARRALLNEAQIMAYIAARWEVETAITKFDGALFDTMDLMRRTDLFLGMHGAGWTNALFLSKVRLKREPRRFARSDMPSTSHSPVVFVMRSALFGCVECSEFV